MKLSRVAGQTNFLLDACRPCATKAEPEALRTVVTALAGLHFLPLVRVVDFEDHQLSNIVVAQRRHARIIKNDQASMEVSSLVPMAAARIFDELG